MNRIALALLATSTLLFAGAAGAQQSPAPPAAPFIDWDKIQIKTTDLGNNTYMLEGQGGNITVAVGTDGIIMVDGQFAPLSAKIKAAIAAISPLPVKYLINTHFHGDHTGGNENFAKDGAIVVAQDNIRVRLAAGTVNGITGAKTEPRPADALPKETYIGGTKTVQVGGRTAQLTHITNAHTDGDTWVYFADANVLCTGDGGAGGDPQGNGQRLDTLLGKILRIDPRRRAGAPVRGTRRQPVRRPGRRHGRDLGLRTAQPVANFVRPGDRRPMGRRCRPGTWEEVDGGRRRDRPGRISAGTRRGELLRTRHGARRRLRPSGGRVQP